MQINSMSKSFFAKMLVHYWNKFLSLPNFAFLLEKALKDIWVY